MILYGALRIDNRVLKESRTLGLNNYRVTVLSTDIGHEKWDEFENVQEVQLTKSTLKKRLSISGLFRFWFDCFKYLMRNRGQIDAVHAHDLTGLPPGFLFCLLHPRIKLIYDSHELFPEAALDKLSVIHYLIFLTLELICSTRANRLITVSPSIVKTLSKRIRAPSTMIMNVPDVERIEQELGEMPRWHDSANGDILRIAYSGVVNVGRGYEILPATAEILKRSLDTPFEFWIIGGGPYLQEFHDLVAERKLEPYFHFSGFVEFHELVKQTVECTIAIALYEGTWNNSAGLSNKLFEYMMLGVPFIFTDLTQSLPLVKLSGASVVSNPANETVLAETIMKLNSDTAHKKLISKKSQDLIKNRFNWEHEEKRLLAVYNTLESD